MLETLISQPHGDVERASAVVTKHNNGFVRIKFSVSTRGDIPHWHKKRIREAGNLVLPGFAYIQQQRRVRLLTALGEDVHGDFRF